MSNNIGLASLCMILGGITAILGFAGAITQLPDKNNPISMSLVIVGSAWFFIGFGGMMFKHASQTGGRLGIVRDIRQNPHKYR